MSFSLILFASIIADFFCDDITAYVGKIAPIIRLPGEEEMRSLAEGALRVLRGQQEAGQY